MFSGLRGRPIHPKRSGDTLSIAKPVCRTITPKVLEQVGDCSENEGKTDGRLAVGRSTRSPRRPVRQVEGERLVCRILWTWRSWIDHLNLNTT